MQVIRQTKSSSRKTGNRSIFILRCHFAVLSVIDSYETKKVLLFMITEYVDYCFLPAGIYLLKVNNRNTKTKCEIYSKVNNKDTWCLYC